MEQQAEEEKELAHIARKLQYMKLVEEGQKVSREITNKSLETTFNDVTTILEANEDISTKTHADHSSCYPDEDYLSSHVLKICHEIVGKALETKNGFSFDEYGKKLVEFVKTEDTLDWNKLGRILIPQIKTAHYTDTASSSGSASEKPKNPKKQQRAPNKPTAMASESRPENIDKLAKEDSSDQNAINYMFNQLCRIIKMRKRNSIPIYEFCIDPNDYKATILKLTLLSYLTNRVVFEFDEDNTAIIRLPTRAEINTLGKEFQISLELNMDVFKEMIEHYGLTEPLFVLDDEYLSSCIGSQD